MAEDPNSLTCLHACHQTPLRKTPLERGRDDNTGAERSPLHAGVCGTAEEPQPREAGLGC